MAALYSPRLDAEDGAFHAARLGGDRIQQADALRRQLSGCGACHIGAAGVRGGICRDSGDAFQDKLGVRRDED